MSCSLRVVSSEAAQKHKHKQNQKHVNTPVWQVSEALLAEQRDEQLAERAGRERRRGGCSSVPIARAIGRRVAVSRVAGVGAAGPEHVGRRQRKVRGRHAERERAALESGVRAQLCDGGWHRMRVRAEAQVEHVESAVATRYCSTREHEVLLLIAIPTIRSKCYSQRSLIVSVDMLMDEIKIYERSSRDLNV